MSDQLDIFRHQPAPAITPPSSPASEELRGDGRMGTDQGAPHTDAATVARRRRAHQLTELPGTTFEDIFGDAA